MKPRIVVFFSSLLLLLFAYTAFSKLANMRGFVATLSRVPLLSWGAGILAWSVSLTELCIGLLLLFSRTRRLGLLLSVALLMTFSIYLVVSLASGSKLPCSCGGIISTLGWKTHLYLNLFFLAIGIAALRLLPKKQHNITSNQTHKFFVHETGAAENLLKE